MPGVIGALHICPERHGGSFWRLNTCTDPDFARHVACGYIVLIGLFGRLPGCKVAFFKMK
jgi:hypothetical protein